MDGDMGDDLRDPLREPTPRGVPKVPPARDNKGFTNTPSVVSIFPYCKNSLIFTAFSTLMRV